MNIQGRFFLNHIGNVYNYVSIKCINSISRPIPLYGGQRPSPEIPTGFPSFNPFLPCFRPAMKLDMCTSLESLYGATSQMATYSLALQEHIRRLQETRISKVIDPRSTINNNVVCPNTLVLNVPKSPVGIVETQNSPVLTNIPTKSDNKETSPRTTSGNPFVESAFPSYNLGRKLFPCPNCRYTTDRRNNLKRHMLTMHQQCSKMLECCGILFRTKASLREHAMIFHYHGYTCYYCGRRFCRKALLKRHLSVHNGQKDYVCSMCDYATSHKSNLERHKKVHQRPEDGQPMDGEEHIDIDQSECTEDISVCSDSEDEEINVHSD